jgi:hypothetical protein
MKQLIISLIALTAPAAFAGPSLEPREEGSHPAKGTLPLTYYSQSRVNGGKGTYCEGKDKDETADGKGFQGRSVPPDQIGNSPKMVAMQNPKYLGCTIKFTSGHFAGKSALVGDVAGDNVIDLAMDTSKAKDKDACKAMLHGGPGQGSVSYELTNCPGDRGTSGDAKRKPGAK